MDDASDESPEPALRELFDVFFAGEDRMLLHPAAVDALLAKGLVSLLLSSCDVDTPGSWPFDALTDVTYVSPAARDLAGLSGFCQLIGIAERDAASAESVMFILRRIASVNSVKRLYAQKWDS